MPDAWMDRGKDRQIELKWFSLWEPGTSWVPLRGFQGVPMHNELIQYITISSSTPF